MKTKMAKKGRNVRSPSIHSARNLFPGILLVHADKMRRWGTKQDVVGNLILDWTDILKDLNKFSPSGGISYTNIHRMYIWPNLLLFELAVHFSQPWSYQNLWQWRVLWLTVFQKICWFTETDFMFPCVCSVIDHR